MFQTKRISIIAQSILLIFAAVFSINAAGEVDPTFTGNAYGELTNQGSIYAITLQPDGKILIGGRFTEVQGFGAPGIARLNADGTVDRTFNPPEFLAQDTNTGALTFGGDIYTIAVQPDGKIVVGGNIFIGIFGQAGVRKGIRRLNADGSIDETFFVELMHFGAVIHDIELQSDGKMILGGFFTLAGNTAVKNLARFNSDGTNDTSFAANTSAAQIKGVEILSDGKIVAGGHDGTTPIVRRYNIDGSADTSFLHTDTGDGTIEALEMQADGKILVSGNYTTLRGVSQGRVSRLNADGSLDQNFNASGAGANAVVNDLAIRSDGKIVIGGNFSSYNSTPMQRITRLNTDGSLDTGYSSFPGITDTAVNDVELLPDNRILAALTTSATVDPLLRFSADGVFDAAFIVKASRGGLVNKVLQQPDGKILVAGQFLYAGGAERRSLARFNADGSLDTTFVPYFNNQSPLPLIYGLALQSDGKILVGSWHGFVLQRLNSDGSQDTSFNTPLTSSSQVYDVALQSDGKILVGGNLTVPNALKFARLNSDGSRDTGFNPAQPNNYVSKILVQPDGKFIVAGSFTTITDIAFRNGIARFSTDGVLDNGFNPPGAGGTLNPVIDVDIQSDGRILAVGRGLRRLQPDGTLDPTLDLAANSDVTAVKVQPDGKILVGGSFSIFNGVPKNGIARLKTNGGFDHRFTAVANRSVFDITLQTDGKILIGGAFTSVSNVAAARVARLLNVAVPDSIPFDYDGDGRADVSVFRPSTNRWYEFLSGTSTVIEKTFGVSGDVVSPADFDGDGKTDIAIYRPSTGDWWYLSSANNSQNQVHWGANGDIPRPSDFDGDGKADFVIFRPSENNWYRLGSTGQVSIVNFGLSGDKPLTGDFDGDGKSDVAVFRPSTGTWWYRSSVNNAQIATQFGVSTDIPTPADFDGDGKTDIAVYRPSNGNWYIINSVNGTISIVNFGLAEDKPVAADYDGDGKADIAVFRPSTGTWYMLRSTQGFSAQQFGISTDIPTPNAFVP
ncbi:MAG: VCBS repeat-containing protein [Pyrinomonadaceae bacterium]|nr:VCBS repeat-containing protein [Pyrinomonadaceae bacterium]